MASYLDSLPRELTDLLEEYVTSDVQVKLKKYGCRGGCCRDIPRKRAAHISLRTTGGSTVRFVHAATKNNWKKFILGEINELEGHDGTMRRDGMDLCVGNMGVDINQRDMEVILRKITKILLTK